MSQPRAVVGARHTPRRAGGEDPPAHPARPMWVCNEEQFLLIPDPSRAGCS